MKTSLIVGVTAAVVFALTVALSVVSAKIDYQVETVTITNTVYVPTGLTPAQIIWMAKLMKCESGVYEGAINPEDLDGTPSHGLLQFKPVTFHYFTGKYGIDGKLMDAEAQVSVVSFWLLNDGEVTWENQFPACVRKLGVPPKPKALSLVPTE